MARRKGEPKGVDDAESQETRMMVIVIVVVQGVQSKCKAKQGQAGSAAGV